MKVTIERKSNVNRGNLLAFLDVCVDDCIVIKGCRILKANNGMFVGLPSEKSEKDGKFYDKVYFKTKEQKREFNDLVLSAYEGNSGKAKSDEFVMNNGEVQPDDINWNE